MKKHSFDTSTIAGRISLFMDKQGIKAVDLAKYMDTSSAYISKMLNTGMVPGANKLSTLKSKFPALNLDWILSGNGTMYTTDTGTQQETTPQDTTPPPPPHPHTQPDATPRATRDTALLEQLLDKSHHTLDRYLSLVEQQQQVINNLSDALVNREEPPQSKFAHVRVKKHHFRHKTIPSQHSSNPDD